MCRVVVLMLIAASFASRVHAAAEDDSLREIAERAVREAAEKAAKDRAEWDRSARDTAEKAAKEAAEGLVKAAAEQAAKAAAEAAAEKAAKDAADAAAKALTDEKAAKEEEKAAKEELQQERRQIDTRIFKLSHASAAEVAENFNRMWSGEFGVNWKLSKIAVSFPESNSIMITAPRVILEACEKTIKALDVEAKQVYIEARFVELGNTASHKVGIDWTFLDGMTGTATLGGGVQTTHIGDGVREYKREITGKNEKTSYGVTGRSQTTTGSGESTVTTTTGGSDGSVSYFNGTLNFSQMSLTLKALDATEDAKTFSNPKIIVSSGKKATVDMTTKYPNVQVAAKKTFNTSGESVDLDMKMAEIPGEDKMLFAKEAFFSWGISLDVTPRIGTNGLINVSIVPTISSLSSMDGGFVTASSSDDSSYSSKYPIIEVQRLITEFNMKSGSTAVIGGLSVTSERQVDSGIPLLRDIPWIGPRLFGSMERVKEQKEIIVFVTVGLVNPQDMQRDAGLPKNAVLGRQYTQGQKLEPGDRPAKNMEGLESLDLRPLEEQARDPLKEAKSTWSFSDINPFTKDPNYKRSSKQNKETR